MKFYDTLKELINPKTWDSKTLYTAFVIALIPIGLSFLKSPPSDDSVRNGEKRAADTHIPRGFVLVPIEVLNQESLDSLLGPYGIVDLFQSPAEGATQNLIASNLRILRAPNNPSHFAVLVRESEARQLLAHGREFTVVVKRPDGNAVSGLMGSPPSQKRRILYGEPE